jgi:hypothetical protein
MNYPLTCVSGYWKIKNKHDDENFTNWFHNTLKINCPYVFFGNKESIELIKQYRGELPTYYIELDIQEFHTCKYADKMITHDVDCPSIELNLIWNEKIFLIERAFRLNPYSSEYFCWVDAGVCVLRNKQPSGSPFPNINRLLHIPKDKFVYSSSNIYNESSVNKTNYYHHVCGTSYILHKNIIPSFSILYDSYIEKLVDKNNIWTDQLILTHIFKDHKDKFHRLSHDYGTIITYLYN